MSERFDLDGGSVTLPEGWEQKVQATLAMPAQRISMMLPGKQGEASAPQPNLVITRTSGAASDQEALEAVLAALTKAIPGLERDPPRAVAFDDGAAGRAARVRFPAGNANIAQLHLVRLAADAVTHLVATAPEGREADLETLERVALSWRP
jgi:hypothetical protein